MFTLPLLAAATHHTVLVTGLAIVPPRQGTRRAARLLFGLDLRWWTRFSLWQAQWLYIPSESSSDAAPVERRPSTGALCNPV